MPEERTKIKPVENRLSIDIVYRPAWAVFHTPGQTSIRRPRLTRGTEHPHSTLNRIESATPLILPNPGGDRRRDEQAAPRRALLLPRLRPQAPVRRRRRRRRIRGAARVLGGAEQRAAGGGPLQREVEPDARGAREQPHHTPQETQ